MENEPTTPAPDAPAATPEAPQAPPAVDFAALQQRLAETERIAAEARRENEAIKRFVVQQVASQPPPAPSPEMMAAEQERFREFAAENPRAAMGYAAEERIAPMVQEIQAQTLQRDAEREERYGFEQLLRSDDPVVRDEAKRYGDEVKQFLANMPLDVRASPGVVETAFRHVRGQHLDDIVNARVKMILERERSGQGGLEAPSGGHSAAPSESPLTAEERRMAKAFGMTEAQWKQNRAAVTRPTGV